MKRATKEAIGQVTISIGIAFHDTVQDPADLFQAADKNLYRAKAAGRNQTVIPS
jgi:diguanylate cyclase (GGDEF)-like protein